MSYSVKPGIETMGENDAFEKPRAPEEDGFLLPHHLLVVSLPLRGFL